METQIDTCPVGVAVLNAMTGEPASFNRGAGRIVSGLLDPARRRRSCCRYPRTR